MKFVPFIRIFMLCLAHNLSCDPVVIGGMMAEFLARAPIFSPPLTPPLSIKNKYGMCTSPSKNVDSPNRKEFPPSSPSSQSLERWHAFIRVHQAITGKFSIIMFLSTPPPLISPPHRFIHLCKATYVPHPVGPILKARILGSRQ